MNAQTQSSNAKASSPEWLREKNVTASFGIGRTTLLRLRNEGKIEFSSLREPGMKQGTLLYKVASIRAYIEGMQERTKVQPGGVAR